MRRWGSRRARTSRTSRRTRVLVLGSSDTQPTTLAYERWWADVSAVEFSTHFIRDNSDFGSDGLSQFDCVVCVVDGNYGFPAPAYLADLVAYVNAGGGVVANSWLIYNADTPFTAEWSTLRDIFPVTYATPGTYGYLQTGTPVTVQDANHPIASGFAASFSVTQMTGAIWTSELPLAVGPGGTEVVRGTFQQAGTGTIMTAPLVTAAAHGSGRAAYMALGSNSGGGTPPSASSDVARLVRSAIRWAAGGGT